MQAAARGRDNGGRTGPALWLFRALELACGGTESPGGPCWAETKPMGIREQDFQPHISLAHSLKQLLCPVADVTIAKPVSTPKALPSPDLTSPH